MVKELTCRKRTNKEVAAVELNRFHEFVLYKKQKYIDIKNVSALYLKT